VLFAAPVSGQEDDGPTEAVRGVLTQDLDGERVPVEGVEIVVETAAGEEVETVTTDEEGRYEVELPGPGDYRATLDQDTLPEGATLRNPDRATLEFTIRAGQSRPLLYPIGEGDREVRSRLDRGLQLAVEGVKFGLIIAMAAIGLSLIFGTTGLVNFAHGEIVTFGALMAYFFNVTVGMPLVLAAVLSMIVTGLLGGALDRGLWRPLRARRTGLIAMLVITIGMSLLLRHLYLYQFGGRTRPFADYQVQQAWDIGPIDLTPRDAFSIALSLVVLIGIGLGLARTRAGKAMRAVADNPDLAASSGIDVERVVSMVWIAGSALAALGGVLLGLTEQVSFQMGFLLLLLMFAGVTLGGLGTAYGALVGSFVVGLFVQVSTLWLAPELKNVGALLILILILLIRPQGILGSAERIG
jgi:branched-chain amino acid transport system permease protein